MRFIEKFEENVRNYPDKVILQDNETSLTFRELDELSGRVYSYIKQRGIGKEDFVMISLPHGVLPYVAMIGVWKAGAAFVVTDVDIPKERIEYIYSECQCRMCISKENWQEILSFTSISLPEETSPNNVAYAVYTSGSEGNPKGSLVEYGFLEFFANTALDTQLINVQDYTIYLMPVPMYTVGAVNTLIQILWSAITVDIAPKGLMRNPKEFKNYLIAHKVNVVFMPPTYLKNYNILTPYLESIILTTERASNIYLENINLLNTYTQTEGYHLCWFKIDKAYENTPIGKPRQGINIVILDDEGKPVENGKAGELCYERKFCRGYVKNEKATAELLANGWQHTGDIARVNEDGNYVILGRKTDMIKINGNRIEPAEIEAAVKRVLGIDWAFAKGFVQPERSFICVYYTADIEIDYAKTREELLKILPVYMIPSYFVHVDSVPRLPNGKVDRKAFQVPDIEGYFAEYAAPTNELEERLCELMQELLGIERIGIHDDFYLLGGDSLRTIKLVSMLDIQDISVADIYSARTPAAIAERWMSRQLL